MPRPWLAVMLCASVVAAPVAASPARESGFFDQRARSAYERGAYAAALRLFMNSYQVGSSSAAAYNVATSAEQAGEPGLAFTYFQVALRAGDLDAARADRARSAVASLRPKLALLTVSGQPEGAQVHVDRRELGSYGELPTTVVVRPGEHTVIVSHPSSVEARHEVVAITGRAAEVKADLPPRRGALHVVANTEGALTATDAWGRVTQLPPRTDHALPVGAYLVRLVASGHFQAEERVHVAESKTTHVDLVAQPRAIQTGRLVVDTGSVRARLLIDGEVTALTPTTLHAIPVGMHRVSFEGPGGKARVASGPPLDAVEIRADATTRLEVSFPQEH